MKLEKWVFWLVRILMQFPAMAFEGYVVSVLWRWFIVTTFAAPSISVAQGLGLSILVTQLTYHHQHKDDDEEKGAEVEKFRRAMYRLFFASALSAMFLLYGWVAHMFV